MSKQSPYPLKFVRALKIESLALAILMLVLTHKSKTPLWILPASFLFFDIGMIGYIINPKVGSKTYNFMHNSTLPTLCLAYGAMYDNKSISVLGYAWIFHIAIDRALGYGLKHSDSFHHTHLGLIKKPSK